MNWKWIGILSIFSVISSTLTVLGLMPKGPMQWIIGLVVGVGISALFAWVTPGKFFKNGFTLGITGGIVGMLIQMLFFNTMVEHNPDMAAKFENLPSNVNPVVMFAAFAPIGIVIGGAVQGFFTWAAAMLMGKNNKKRPEPPPMSV